MTVRQRLLKAIYPLLIGLGKAFKMKSKTLSASKPAVQSFYELSAKSNAGEEVSFAGLRGKKVLIVNTASDCGYTAQLSDLEELFEKKKDKLMILAFPANDFKEQEKGSNEEIAAFCKRNYGVTFPLMEKSTVIVSPDQNNVFKWLTDKERNGWNEQAPTWNFCKYLINEQGNLTHFFEAGESPTGKKILNAVEEKS